MRSLSKSKLFGKKRKAQFFVLSTFAIVSILYFVSRWVEPYTIIDTSSVARHEEPFIFNNIKEKLIYTVNSSKTIDELEYNLQEFKEFAETHAIKRGAFYVSYETISPYPPGDGIGDFPVVIVFNLTLVSPKITIGSVFETYWPP